MKVIPVDFVLPDPKALDAAELRKVVRVLQKQVKRDFAPVWEVSADLRVAPSPERARPGAWQIAIFDSAGGDIDGYHELTREGLPLGRVYLRSARECKLGWSTTASHELLELLANPDTTRSVFVWEKHHGGRIYIHEVCDACQDDPFCYAIDKVYVSDFIYPAWFETWRAPRSARFDQAKKLTRPFQVPKGCYSTYFDARRRRWVDNDGTGKRPPRLIPMWGYGRGGSRKHLRQVPRDEWRRSVR
jgi:hypothetical protein